MPTLSACPDAVRLQQFVQGRVGGAEAEGLEQHVAVCPACLTRLGTLPADDVLELALRGTDDTPPTPFEDLARALNPILKRLRPIEPPTTLPPGPEPAGSAPAAAEPLAFLAPPLEPGDLGRLGPYRVLRLLGAGGMGMVFLAEDPRLRRQLALKVIKPALGARGDARERFLREARAVAAVEHENIVAIFEADEAGGVPYLAMPLLRGESLEDRLERTAGPVPVDDILRVGREVAAGLAAAHDRGLVHRDVKPGNIWLEEHPHGSGPQSAEWGRVKILDFGLARTLDAVEPGPGQTPGGGPRTTEAGAITGTPGYLAPEQAQAQVPDARADLFALGCVLYRMATGRIPFEGPDTVSTLLKVVIEEPPPPRTLNPELPPALAGLIERLLAKRPSDRPPSAHAVVAALRTIEGQRAGRLTRRRRLLLGAACVLATFAMAAGLYWALSPAPLPEEPGEVTFDCDEPDRLALRRGDDEERVLDLRAGRTHALPPGDYALRPVADAGNRRLVPERVLVKAGEKQTLTLRLVGEVHWHRTHHGFPVRGLAVTAGKAGPVVLAVSDDRSLSVWNPLGGERPTRLWHRDSPLRCVAVSPDGRQAATGSGDVGPRAVQVIRFWNLNVPGPRPGELKSPEGNQVNALAYSPDGKRLLSGESDGSVLLWDLKAGVAVAEQGQAHDRLGVLAVAFLPDGKHVLTAGGDGAVVQRTTADLEPMRTLPDGHTAAVRGLAVLPGGKEVVSGGRDRTVRVWNLAGGPPRKWAVPASVEAVAVSPDGARVLTGDAGGALRLWDRAAQQEIIRFDAHAKGVTAVAFTPDGRRAVSGGMDGAVRLWELPR